MVDAPPTGTRTTGRSADGRAVTAAPARRRSTPVDTDVAAVDAGAVRAEDRHGRAARGARDRDRERCRVPGASTTASRGGSVGGCAAWSGAEAATLGAALASSPGRSSVSTPTADHDREQQHRLEHRRAAQAREAAEQQRAVEPAEHEQRHEERRLDDQRAAVRRRPDLGHAAELGQRAAEAADGEHAHGRERDGREPRDDRVALVVVGGRARHGEDERDEPAEPDGGRERCARGRPAPRAARLVAVEGVPGERRRHDQHGSRSAAATAEHARVHRRERGGGAGRRATAVTAMRSTSAKRVPEAASWTMPLPPRNTASSAKKSRWAIGRCSRVPRMSRASSQKPHDADTDEEAEEVERPQDDGRSRQAGSRRRAPAAAAPVPHRPRTRARPARGWPSSRDDAPADGVVAVGEVAPEREDELAARDARLAGECARARLVVRRPRCRSRRGSSRRTSGARCSARPASTAPLSGCVRTSVACAGAVAGAASAATASRPARRFTPREGTGSPLLALPLPCRSTSTSARTGTCSRSSTA